MDALTPMERRVLGVLIEKALTASVPEPLTLNSIVVGCNQKSNREPVVNYEEPEVDDTLTSLKRRGLVFHQTGSRTDRWRHNTYDAWKLGKPEVAFIAELLLRGPQTAAEAKSRASRMEPISGESFQEMLRDLVNRNMIQWLTPEAKRGAILTHQFYSPNELTALKARFAGFVSAEENESQSTPITTTKESGPTVDLRFEQLFSQVASLITRVDQLELELSTLKQSLGG